MSGVRIPLPRPFPLKKTPFRRLFFCLFFVRSYFLRADASTNATLACAIRACKRQGAAAPPARLTLIRCHGDNLVGLDNSALEYPDATLGLLIAEAMRAARVFISAGGCS